MSAGLPLPASAPLSFWRDEVERAERVAKTLHHEWDENVQWFSGKSPDAATRLKQNVDFVNVNVDFYQVEQKLAQLFYETPDLQLTGTGLLVGQTPILSAHKAVLEAILGDNHMDILGTVHLAIKDCLCVSGTGPVILGYEPFQMTAMAPDPMTGMESPVQVTIHERFYADRFSPKKLLIPADFHSTDWDQAPWLGMRFRMALPKARRQFRLPPEFTGTTDRDDRVLNRDQRMEEATAQRYVDGVVIWYRACHFDDQPVHPELYRELVLIDGLETEARHRDSPHQTILPNGRMSGDSLIGNPIHPLTIRTVPDAAYVPSDSQMTRPLVRELCKFRTQMVQMREANRKRVLYDSGKLIPETIAKIEDGSLGALIGVEEGALAQGVAAIMAEVVTGQTPRDNYTANDYIERDIAKTLALGANQTSVADASSRSATEISVMDQAANVRLDAERRQVLRWYLRLVDKMSALICRYLTPEMAVPYIGQEAAMVWSQWDKTLADSKLLFKAKPDSQIRLDAASERKFALDLYQFTANDPNVNRVELLKELFVKAGHDPAKVVVEQLPEKKPEPPSMSMAIKSESLNPLMPEYPNVYQVLTQLGVQNLMPPVVDPMTAMEMQSQIAAQADAQTAHGGVAEKTRPLSKQQGEQSGERSGPKTA